MNIPFVTFEKMHSEISHELTTSFCETLKENTFIQGNKLLTFEKNYSEYCGTNYAVGVGNGLDALYLIMKALDIGSGDEVIIPSNTFIATAIAVSLNGATPVLVEPDIESYTINPDLIENAITDKTKAIIPVHLYGRAADMDRINAIAKKYHLYVIEDAAQAHGARYKGQRTGRLGNAAGFSFYPGKNLGALGDAGMVTSNDSTIANRVKTLGNYGSDYKYHHIIQGNNSRLDEMQAGFLDCKLTHLDDWNENRRKTASRYLNGIVNRKVVLPKPSDEEYDCVWHIFAIRCNERERLAGYLLDNGIHTAMHYPTAIHNQLAYKDLGLTDMNLPIAAEIARTELSLPMYYGMTDEEITYIIDVINRYR